MLGSKHVGWMTPGTLGKSGPTTQIGCDPRVLMLVAHPGHEIWVHGWMEQSRPLVLVLTDGSGSRGSSKLPATTKALRLAQCRIGDLFGRFTDRGFHQALVMKDHGRFMALAEELADLMVQEQIDWVVGEALEGVSPGADVCRILIDTAVAMVSRERPACRNYEFSLRPFHAPTGTERANRILRFPLDADRWKRKYQTLLTYPEMGSVLQQSPLQVEKLKEEILILTNPWAVLRQDESTRGDYDEMTRSESGTVSMIRFREHILPLGEALRLVAASSRAVA